MVSPESSRPWPRLENPPIVEALIDVRVVERAGVLEELGRLAERVRDDYPHVLHKLQQTIEVSDSGQARQVAHREEARGFGFTNSARDRIVQARVDGFTFNWLGRYESWEALRDEARRLYDIYRAVASPEGIERVAVRYVNRMQVPEGAELGELMRLRVEIPADLPQRLGGVMTRVLMPFDGSIVANVTSVIEPAAGSQMTWTLDIDVIDFERSSDSRSDAIWPRLDRLRSVKNQVFFNVLTESSLERQR